MTLALLVVVVEADVEVGQIEAMIVEALKCFVEPPPVVLVRAGHDDVGGRAHGHHRRRWL